jgi:hypothetical protein
MRRIPICDTACHDGARDENGIDDRLHRTVVLPEANESTHWVNIDVQDWADEEAL